MSSMNELRERLAAPQSPVIIEGILPEARRIPLSYGRHMPGWHPVRRCHPPVPVESRLEARVVSTLADVADVQKIQAQPVTIVYRLDGRIHRYTPDFLITLTQIPEPLEKLGFGKQTYLEVKPQRRALQAEHRLRHKFAALRQATGLPVVLVTDWDLPPRAGEEVANER